MRHQRKLRSDSQIFLLRLSNLVLGSLFFMVVGLGGCSSIKAADTKRFATVEVRSGDNLGAIARRFGVNVTDLAELNGLSVSQRLEVGSIIVVPQGNGRLATAMLSESGRRYGKGQERIRLGQARRYLGTLHWPVKSGTITSWFGQRQAEKFHDGVDISARDGTAILAAHQGKVIFSGKGPSGYGRMVVVRDSGLMTVYAHNSRNAISVGDSVIAGEKIAEVGSSGHATGAHLHFEVRIPDGGGEFVAVDPQPFL